MKTLLTATSCCLMLCSCITIGVSTPTPEPTTLQEIEVGLIPLPAGTAVCKTKEAALEFSNTGATEDATACAPQENATKVVAYMIPGKAGRPVLRFVFDDGTIRFGVARMIF